jgi:hypothetical protein
MSMVIEKIELNIDGQTVIVERLDDGTFRKPDYLAGAEREVIGQHIQSIQDRKPANTFDVGLAWQHDITAPATPLAAQWQGFGTALKPAWEPIIVARKPLAGTVAENVTRFGTGAINIDGCRVGVDDDDPNIRNNASVDNSLDGATYNLNKSQRNPTLQQSRWPANLIHDGSAEVLAGFPQAPSAGRYLKPKNGIYVSHDGQNCYGKYNPKDYDNSYAGDTGSAARFFKSCPPDDICLLCLAPKHDTMSAWKNILALNAEKNGWTTQATNEFIARLNVVEKQSEPLAQSAKSAVSLCDSCEMFIAVALVGIKTSAFSNAELQVILDCISSYKNSTLTQSLVLFAESQDNIDITQTMINLLKSSGCANPATTNFIPEIKKSELKRFVYSPKASKADRDEGCEGLEPRVHNDGRDESLSSGDVPQNRSNNPDRNFHPTVKPTSLMRYLCRLVTPPNGTILDPFMGSGSTGKAAMLEGFNFIGIDTEIEYVEIAARRIEHACEKVGIVVEQPMMFETKRETVDRPKQMMLL